MFLAVNINIFYLEELKNWPDTKWWMKVLQWIQKVLVLTEFKKEKTYKG